MSFEGSSCHPKMTLASRDLEMPHLMGEVWVEWSVLCPWASPVFHQGHPFEGGQKHCGVTTPLRHFFAGTGISFCCRMSHCVGTLCSLSSSRMCTPVATEGDSEHSDSCPH